MSQSFARVLVHLIFSTKNREPFIDDSIMPSLHAYIMGIFDEIGCPSIQVGGVSDHVHLVFGLSRTYTIAQVVETVKTSSSKWIKAAERGQRYANFHWQSGYGAFSVSQSGLDDVIAYVRNQAEHHKEMTFQDEYRRFLERYKVDYDERYVWD